MTNGNTPCISGGYTNMMTDEDSDLIRRSDALDCFHCWVDRYGDVHTPDEMAEYRAIEELPSAQPEIIRCKECKHQPFDGEDTQGFGVEFPDEKCPCQCDDGWYNWRPNNEWFCANAERRTDEV